MPLMVAPVIATLVWQLMLNTSVGIIEKLLNIFNVYNFPWAADPRYALLTVALIDIWVYTPFVMLLVFAGLNTLPKSPFESAAIDGGSLIFVFQKLLLPIAKAIYIYRTDFSANGCFTGIYDYFCLDEGWPWQFNHDPLSPRL